MRTNAERVDDREEWDRLQLLNTFEESHDLGDYSLDGFDNSIEMDPYVKLVYLEQRGIMFGHKRCQPACVSSGDPAIWSHILD